ncbi:MAG: hypothetical protein PF518_02725 [Spirochaetaceae bacterium]|nr:hypothetical protein [Spirochaetaceae bacterium]
MKKIFIAITWYFLSISAFAQWEELEILSNESIWASSVFEETLNGKKVVYGPQALFDNDNSTPWVEAASGDGIGESITILLQKAVTDLTITNGFASSIRLFNLNNRVKAMNLSLITGLTAPGLVTENDYYLYFVKESPLEKGLILKDSPEKQHFSFPLNNSEQFEIIISVIDEFQRDYPDFYRMILMELNLEKKSLLNESDIKLIMEIFGYYALKLTITDVYMGDRYRDTCISELYLDLVDY